VGFVPEGFRSYELCLEAMNVSGTALSSVPEQHQTEKMCIKAIHNCLRAFYHFPKKYRNLEFLLNTNVSEFNLRRLDFVEKRLWLFLTKRLGNKMSRI